MNAFMRLDYRRIEIFAAHAMRTPLLGISLLRLSTWQMARYGRDRVACLH